MASAVVGGLLVTVLAFFVCRWIVLSYWRVHELVGLLSDISGTILASLSVAWPHWNACVREYRLVAGHRVVLPDVSHMTVWRQPKEDGRV